MGMVEGYPSLSRKGSGQWGKKREDLWGRVPYTKLPAWCETKTETENILKEEQPIVEIL